MPWLLQRFDERLMALEDLKRRIIQLVDQDNKRLAEIHAQLVTWELQKQEVE